MGILSLFKAKGKRRGSHTDARYMHATSTCRFVQMSIATGPAADCVPSFRSGVECRLNVVLLRAMHCCRRPAHCHQPASNKFQKGAECWTFTFPNGIQKALCTSSESADHSSTAVSSSKCRWPVPCKDIIGTQSVNGCQWVKSSAVLTSDL